MSAYIIQAERIIDDFIKAVDEVFSQMAAVTIQVEDVEEIDGQTDCMDVTTCMDITGILGFSGGRRGSILVTFSEAVALKAVGGMLDMEFNDINADVRDGVGEIVNIIAGTAKTRLQPKGISFDLSIPNTIIGFNHQITAPASTSRTRVRFTTIYGNFFLEVNLKEDK
ncbi:MAG TPA: chemotaxis protein CheX [bacterium]